MKVHLSLATRDLDASVAFYRSLLMAEPVKHYADYALFLTDDPGLELAIDANPAVRVVEGAHYGLVVEDARAVEAAATRLTSAGHVISVETDATCCYAIQSKVWSTDPDGRRWETYFVIAETEQRDGRDACCSS